MRELELGVLRVSSDARWFATFPAATDPAAPIAELRRWPGDTVAALYTFVPAAEGAAIPPVPGARLAEESAGADGSLRWSGVLETDAGERPAVWIERRIGSAPARLGMLVLPGDAGLGAAAVPDLLAEAMFLLARVEVREAAWKTEAAPEPGRPVRLPVLGAPPGDRSEAHDPWQVAIGKGFTLGLPPGFRAYRLDVGVPPPDEVPGALLWFRGRCRDTAGESVAVGDGRRYGYVAQVTAPSAEWIAGTQAPLAAPTASLAIERAVASPQLAETTGSEAATVSRWREPGFEGDWIVFRLRVADAGWEVGMPVLSGRRSASLFWIGESWRPAGRFPAPPPIDPAARFGIRFQRLTPTGRKQTPWIEGRLEVPGLQVEVARDLVPAAALRSVDGYPVRFIHRSGRTAGALERLDVAEAQAWLGSQPDLAPLDKPSRHGADRVLRDAAGRCLFAAAEGHAFLFSPEDLLLDEAASEPRELWELMLKSVRLVRP